LRRPGTSTATIPPPEWYEPEFRSNYANNIAIYNSAGERFFLKEEPYAEYGATHYHTELTGFHVSKGTYYLLIAPKGIELPENTMTTNGEAFKIKLSTEQEGTPPVVLTKQSGTFEDWENFGWEDQTVVLMMRRRWWADGDWVGSWDPVSNGTTPGANIFRFVAEYNQQNGHGINIQTDAEEKPIYIYWVKFVVSNTEPLWNPLTYGTKIQSVANNDLITSATIADGAILDRGWPMFQSGAVGDDAQPGPIYKNPTSDAEPEYVCMFREGDYVKFSFFNITANKYVAHSWQFKGWTTDEFNVNNPVNSWGTENKTLTDIFGDRRINANYQLVGIEARII